MHRKRYKHFSSNKLKRQCFTKCYKDKGFEIIVFSTDRTLDIANWRKTVDKNNLSWQNVLDENGVEAKKYNINQFPTTFLLDAEGNIIKKNISPEELAQFLEENLKN
ncbi:TlpA disulfide reductase family protein [Chryseobacterium gotjawalense]|uniref:TlpA disulfide reductase family protein n=1 Tax=Chryseobacterium gotjawalense TaxID=3042315 RepID=A0ABY8RF48_9FLAO|nr:TlpA disulfide reductase family protein [Chryseobacterium sp. wdc7]WHF52601.1 TlpA disulfide reductase family protein [Chryseobacterium sp. wdc7]